MIPSEPVSSSTNEDNLAELNETIERLEGSSSPADRRRVSSALVDKGIVLGALGREDEQLQTYAAVVEQFADDSDTTVRVAVARALWNRGETFRKANRLTDAIQEYDRLIERFFGEF